MYCIYEQIFSCMYETVFNCMYWRIFSCTVTYKRIFICMYGRIFSRSWRLRNYRKTIHTLTPPTPQNKKIEKKTSDLQDSRESPQWSVRELQHVLGWNDATWSILKRTCHELAHTCTQTYETWLVTALLPKVRELFTPPVMNSHTFRLRFSQYTQNFLHSFKTSR